MTGIKTRIFPEENYKAIYCNGKTIRLALDGGKIGNITFPEFYDVKITNYCEGKCPWCYQDSTNRDKHFENVLGNIDTFFGSMTPMQRPFQVAIGGGEPTTHPKFIQILKAFHDLGITPNYTTNGMNLTSDIIEATKKYCGGVAVSCHPHLRSYWTRAATELHANGIELNFHIIISDKDSVDTFLRIFNGYKDMVSYFVLLPHIAKGRATKVDMATKYLFDELAKMDTVNRGKVAFGANFYEDLKDYKTKFDVSLYEPEIFSKYLDMGDMKLYNSSFEEDA